MTTSINEILRKIEACEESRTWVRSQKTRSLSKLWASCPRGDWTEFLLKKIGYDLNKLEPAYKVRNETVDAAHKVYDETCDAAYKVYNETCGAAEKVYNKTCGAAWKVRNETCGAAWKQYADDIRKIVSFQEVAELLEKTVKART